jgi:hypothetical protein
MTPTNLSSKKEISFWATGDGRTYSILLFAQSLGFQPAIKPFVAGPEWKQFTFPLSAFNGMSGHDLMGVLFSAGPPPGTFAFQIDDVQFK